MSAKDVVISDMGMVFNSAWKAFTRLWGKMFLVVLLTSVIGAFGFGIAFGIAYFSFGGLEGLESLYANIRTTFNMTIPQTVILSGLFIFLFVWSVYFTILGNISLLLVLKDYVRKQDNKILDLYFVRARRFVGRFLLLSVRVFFYLFWPMLLLLLVFPMIPFLAVAYKSGVLVIVLMVFLVISFVVIYLRRFISVIFAYMQLITQDKGVKESFEKSLDITKGIIFKVFVMIFLIALLLAVPRVFLSVLGEKYSPLFGLLAVVYYYFISFPLLKIYVYFLMFYLEKKQSIGKTS